MNIALIGYGKMGHEMEQAALNRGHRIVARCDPAPEAGVSDKISAESLVEAEVCVEFTRPEAALENIRKIAGLKKTLVVGTTGWYQHLAEVRSLVEENRVGLVYAPNFSLGVNLFYQIAGRAAELLNHFEEYDVYGSEVHHRHKIDSPSGTARQLSQIVLQKFARKKKMVTESLNRAITPDEFQLISVRSGEFPGIHSLTFDSEADTIELIHSARSRSGFALGALLAAEWIVSRRGLYTFEQVLADMLKIGEDGASA